MLTAALLRPTRSSLAETASGRFFKTIYFKYDTKNCLKESAVSVQCMFMLVPALGPKKRNDTCAAPWLSAVLPQYSENKIDPET